MPTDITHNTHKTNAGQPRGAVLMFTLVILLLMALLGAAVFVSTTTEVQTTRNSYQGRDTFNKADAAARLGVLFSRSLLNPSAGTPYDLVRGGSSGSGRPPFEIVLMSGLTLDNLSRVTMPTTVEDIRERYLRAAAADGHDEPMLTLNYGGQVVGTVAVDLNQQEAIEGTRGGSVQDMDYDENNGNMTIIYLVVAADGRMPWGTGGGADEDKANYFTGEAMATHSIINTIYRQVMP
jgi:Tfp pilus assembly protein PilX